MWLWKRDEPGFASSLELAESNAKCRLLLLVLQAAMRQHPSSWQAAAWLLERRWPDDFGLKQRVEISIDLRDEAERLAAAHGLNVDAVLLEADAIVRSSLRDHRPR